MNEKSQTVSFSVLMSVYYKETATFLDRALRSVWDDQEVKPSQLVVVKDGKLTRDLDQVLKNWEHRLGDQVLTIVCLDENIGLGGALNEGLAYCRNELVARMDADDISAPERFREQLMVFQDSQVDVCGSIIQEFEDGQSDISTKRVPQFHDEIEKYAKYRNPINHMTVMFKKSSVVRAGGYLPMLYFEDYYLWVRMLRNGNKFYNLQKALVYARAGSELLARRKGVVYALAEIRFMKRMHEIGVLSGLNLLRNVFFRVPFRLLPSRGVAYVYKTLRRA